MNKTLLLLLLCTFISCNNKAKDKIYYYTLFELKDRGNSGYKGSMSADTICAENDSIAFVKACKKYASALGGEMMMKKKLAELGSEPLEETEYNFYLYKSDTLEDISSGSFLQNPDSIKLAIWDQVLSYINK